MSYVSKIKYSIRSLRYRSWIAIYFVLGIRLPISYRKGGCVGRSIRYWACRRILGQCGTNVNMERGAYIEHPMKLEIGDNSGVGVNAYIDGPVRIGRDVMMGPDVRIYRRNHQIRRSDIPMIQQGFDEFIPLIIEDDVWIGGGATIVPSVTRIGQGSVIAAGAVVVKNVPSFAIVGGNPARLLRDRRCLHEPACSSSCDIVVQ